MTTALSESETRNYLRRSAVTSLFNSASSALATALLLPLVIRRVGMDVYGLWAVLGIFIGVASALDFGIWKALVYLLPRRVHSPSELISSAIALCLIAGTGFALILAVLLLAGLPLFGSAVAAHKGLGVWLALSGAMVVFCSLFTNLARGVLESMYCGHIVNIGYAILTLLLYAVPAVTSHWATDPRILIAGSVAVYLAVAIAHWAYVLMLKPIQVGRPSTVAVKSILGYGLSSFRADIPSILLGPALLYLFVVLSSDAVQFGTFELAFKIATLAATTLGLLATPFFALAANAAADQHALIWYRAGKFLRVTVPLAVSGWLVYWMFGQGLLKWFFKTTDANLFHTSLVLLAGSALAAAFEPIARMQMGLARLKRLFYVRLSMLVTTIVALCVLQWLPNLERFSTAAALGFGSAAAGLLLTYMIERLATPNHSLHTQTHSSGD
jgi:O-antigen/teichoic acid export membrane protein